MKKRIQIGAVLLLAAGMMLIFAVTGGTQPQEEEEPEGTEQPIEELLPEPAVVYRNPLTGLPTTKDLTKLRPVAVMLNNVKVAQPQLGVSQADIIYEIPAEGDVTRMIALFQSMEGVGDLGTIRSTRPYYLEVALGHDALLVHAGGSPEAYQDIKSWKVDNMDGVRGGSDASIFWRDPERRRTKGYEHSLLTSGTNVQGYLDEGHFRLEHRSSFAYPQGFTEDGTPAEGAEASRVEVRFSSYKTGVFEYDPQQGKYMVSQYGGPYVDGNTDEQVRITNLLVLETSIRVLDSEGRLRVSLGSGKGTFFCGGRSVPIRWEKGDRDDPFVYTLEDGSPLLLGQGTSYVCILNQNTGRVTVK